MGVLHGRDLLSPNYLTAIIIDSLNFAHFVPIKHEVGPYFFAAIDDDLYAFDTRGLQATHRKTLVKSFRFQIFFTDCFKPVNEHWKGLEQILLQNNLPRMDRMMLKFFHILSRAEKKDFKPHQIPKILDKLEKEKEDPKYKGLYKNMITYVKELELDEIVTPLRRVTEQVTGDFVIPDAKFMASIRTAFEILDKEDKIVNNVPLGPKNAWLKWIAIFSIIGLVTALGFMAYSFGWFDGLTDMFSGVGGGIGGGGVNPFGGFGSAQEQQFMNRFPTSEAAKAALDAGKISVSDIPPSLREHIVGLQGPKLSP